MKTFSELNLSPDLTAVVAELGYERPSAIQAESIPLLMAGKDIVGEAKTGSGKTAAFSIPILEKIDLSTTKHVQALILCPTRELCTQVAREIRKLGRRHSGLQVLILSGGQPIFPQLTALEKGVHIAVGTPGRVIDHIQRKKLDLRRLKTIVLDEADRMLDMGFEEDMETILSQTPETRQTIFFSATFPTSIESMSRKYQKTPSKVKIKEALQEAPQIRQSFYEVQQETKFKAILFLLQNFKPESAVIFCNLKTSVMELTEDLGTVGISALGLHGDLEQADRDRVMAMFRNQSSRILVATDVAARGIDVDNLDVVINFDLPATPDIYVHRIGRTGRAGKKGQALSLFTGRERTKIDAIEKMTERKFERKKLDTLDRAEITNLTSALDQTAKMQTLYIGGGRKDKVRPGDILGALTGDAGKLAGSDIGKIEIHDRFSYVAVSSKLASMALVRLRDGKIKGRKFRIELTK